MLRRCFSSVFLNYTKRERTGIMFLIFLIVLLSFSQFIFPFFIQQKTYDHSVFEKEIALLKIKPADSTKNFYKASQDDEAPQYYHPSEKNYYAVSKESKGELFFFDPNTLDEAGWKKLGVRDKTIATIQKYISKGGRFKQPADIDKIWGLSDDEVNRLIPYIKIETTKTGKEIPVISLETKPVYESKKNTTSIIDINTADTTAFISLPGIGSKLSQRIISFRDKLGGFYKVEQVAETFGLPDSTFQKIKSRLVVKDAAIKQININTASIDELKTHPYIRYQLANAIVQYRNQHGNFSNIGDLKKIAPITDEVFEKIRSYLKVN